MVGEHVEFSCQLSPPQSAEHMNIGWYRDHYSQPVHMHEKGKEVSGKYTQNYMNRTVLLKDGLREGKMTLRIHNISVFDEGEYHCLFKDDDTDAEASTHLKVAGKDRGVNSTFLDNATLDPWSRIHEFWAMRTISQGIWKNLLYISYNFFLNF